MSSVNQMSELLLSNESEIRLDFEKDEDDEYCLILMRDVIIFDTLSTCRVSDIKEFFDEGVLKAIELTLDNGQMIFVDATYYTGLKLGSEFLKDKYIENSG